MIMQKLRRESHYCASHYCASNIIHPIMVDGQKLQFHRFPENALMRARWAEALGRKNWTPNPQAFLCGLHFQDSDYLQPDAKSKDVKRLNPAAIPSIMLRADPATIKLTIDEVSSAAIVQEQIKAEPVEDDSTTSAITVNTGKRGIDDIKPDTTSPLKIARVETIPHNHFYQGLKTSQSSAHHGLSFVRPTIYQTSTGTGTIMASSATNRRFTLGPQHYTVVLPPTTDPRMRMKTLPGEVKPRVSSPKIVMTSTTDPRFKTKDPQVNPPANPHFSTQISRTRSCKPTVPKVFDRVRDPILAHTMKLIAADIRSRPVVLPTSTNTRIRYHRPAAPLPVNPPPRFTDKLNSLSSPPRLQAVNVRILDSTPELEKKLDIEKAKMKHTIDQQKVEIKKLNDEINTKTATIKSLNLKVTKAELACKDFGHNEKRLEDKIEELTKTKRQAAVERRAMCKEMENLRNTIDSLRQENDDHSNKYLNLQKKMAMLESGQQAERLESLKKNKIINTLRSGIVELRTEKQRQARLCDHPPDLCALFHPGVKK